MKKALIKEVDMLRQQVAQLEAQCLRLQDTSAPWSQESRQWAVRPVDRSMVDEINDVLTVICGYTELAQYELPLDSLTWQRLQRVSTAGWRAAVLLQRLIMFPPEIGP
jgi:hypothetical protein